MPTIKGISGPYRFFFYSFDCNEPPHVHVEHETATCKFWLQPLTLASSHGFSPEELNRVRRVIQANLALIREAWNEHCGTS